MIRPAALLAIAFVVIISAQAAPRLKEAPIDLERKLHGVWYGPACGGDWTFGADGRFEVRHYSPGNKEFAGTWKVRWNALPPTLVLTCKTSDDPAYLKIDEASEVKLVELNDDALTYQYPDGHTARYRRSKE